MILQRIGGTALYSPKDEPNPRLLFLRDVSDLPYELDLVDCWIGGNTRGNFIFLDQWDPNITEVQLRWLFEHSSQNPMYGNIAWLRPSAKDHFQFLIYTEPSLLIPLPPELCTQHRDLVREIKDNPGEPARVASSPLHLLNGQIGLCGDQRLEITGRTVYVDADSNNVQAKIPITGVIQIQLKDPNPGLIQFDLDLKDDYLSALDVGIRYFFEDTGSKKSCFFPVFKTIALPIKTTVTLDLFLTGPLTTRPPVVIIHEQVLESTFRTPYGQPVKLLAKIGASLKLASRTDLSKLPDDATKTYLQPNGPFETLVDGDPVLLCGLSGTEYCKLPVKTQVSFEPDSAAWVVSPNSRVPKQGFLSLDARTAWIRLSPPLPGVVIYFAQPHETEVYSPNTQSASDSLAFQDLPLFKISDVLFPVLPLGQLANSALSDGSMIESSAVSQERRLRLGLNGQQTGVGLPVKAATPQGFVVDIEPLTSQWSAVSLALCDTGQSVSLTKLAPSLADALARSRVFAVVSSDGLGNFSSDISVAGWAFNAELTPPNSTTNPLKDRAVLIIKSSDRSIRELVKDTSVWATDLNPNQDISELQQFIQQQFAIADKEPSVFQNFITVIDSPNWNGVLILNCALAADSFPDEIRGLTSGLPTSSPPNPPGTLDVRAHHVGMQLNKVSNTNGVPDIDRSSLFAVIYYYEGEPAPPPSQWPGCGGQDIACFHVHKLVVVFDNSELKQFNCTLLLFVKKLFDEAVNSSVGGELIQLEGSFERHAGQDVYSFSSQQTYSISLNSFIFDSLVITKVQFASAVDQQTGATTSRFTFWGTLKLKQLTVFDVLSFDALNFSNLAIKLQNGNFSFEPGDISFDATLTPPRAGSLLDLFPIKLKGFEFAPIGFKLPDLGFFPIPSTFGGASDIPDGVKPRFGLLFDLDLGSLGSLLPTIHGFHADVLLWWCKDILPPQFPFGFGLRLPDSTGGKLEIGIEGVLRLVIDSVVFDRQQTAIVLALKGCAIQVLGKQFPSDGKLTVVLFTNRDNPTAGPIGWFASYLDASGNPKYVGAGQRVSPTSGSFPSSAHDALQLLENNPPHQAGDALDVTQLMAGTGPFSYSPNSGWTLAADWNVFSFVHLELLFSDPNYYALRVLDKYEIQYRKVSDGVGEYYVDVPPPLPTLPLDVVDITLGTVGVSIFTNGDFKIDFGFPGPNYDFSRSFHAEIPPLTGSAGFYIAKASPDTTSLLGSIPPSNIFMIGLAAQAGLGVDFSLGPFRAGASITVFGIIEGAIAFDKSTPLPNIQIVGWLLQGQWGIIGEIYGSVSFAIISVDVHIRVYAAIGVRLCQRCDVRVWIDAGVEVEARVVIADFDVLFGHVHIEVDFSFSTNLHWETTLAAQTLRQLAAATVPLQWTKGYKYYPTPRSLPLYFYFEPTIVSGKLTSVIFLGLETSPASSSGTPPRMPTDDLIEAMVAWTLTLYMQQVLHGVDKFTIDDLYNLNETLNSTTIKTLARTPGNDPLDSDHIKSFLKDNFAAVVSAPPNRPGASVSFAAFPLMTECTVNYVKDGINVNSVDFSNLAPRDQNYEDFLGTYLESIKFRPDSSPVQPSGPQTNTNSIPMVDILFQDYFDGLEKAAIHQIYETLRTDTAASTGMSIKQLLAANPSYAHVVGQLNRFHKSGLRIPGTFDASGNPGTLAAIYDLTGQQYPFNLPSNYTGRYQIQFNANPNASWFTQVPVPNPDGPVAELIDSAIQNLEQLFPTLTPDAKDFPVPTVLPHNKTFALEHCLNLENKYRIWLMPDEMRAELSGVYLPGLTVELKQRSTNDPAADATDVDIPEIPYANFDTRWATLVNITVRQIPDPSTPPYYKDVYQLMGTDDESRARLTELLGDTYASTLASGKAYMLRRLDSSDTSILTDDKLGPSVIGLAKVNLSTESFPGRNLAGSYEDVVRADLTDPAGPAAFISLVVQSSTVNAGGFYLRYPGLPPWLFEGMAGTPQTARLTLLITFGVLPTNKAAHGYNSVILLNAPGAPAPEPPNSPAGVVFYAETPERFAYSSTTPPGHFTFAIRRINPDYNYLLPSGARGTRDELLRTTGERAFRTGTVMGALDALFSQLIFNIVDGDFSGTPESTPIGPQKPASADSMFVYGTTSTTTTQWEYRRTIPAYLFLKQSLPHPAATHYDCVGKTLILQFGFRDLFGNPLPSANWTLTKQAIFQYSDPIIPVSAWPGFASVYNFELDSDNNCVLVVTLTFDGTKIGKDHSTAALERLNTISEQINDKNLSISAATSANLNAVPIGNQFSDLLILIAGAIKAINNPTPPIQLSHSFRFAIDPAAPNTENLFTLTASWKLSRTAFVDPNAAQYLPEVREVSSVITPDIRATTGNDYSLVNFAMAFEKCFTALKLAVKSGSRETSHAPTPVWGIRKTLLEFQINDERPWYYSPRPISSSLWSGDVQLPDYAGGDSGSQRVTDIDLDVHARYFLNSLEEVLSPSRAFSIDEQKFNTLMKHKRTLANKLQLLLEPLDTRDPSTDAEKLAREAFYDRVSANLTQFYSTDSIFQLPITVDTIATGGKEPPRIYGKILGTPLDPTLGKQFSFSFSPAKVPAEANPRQESYLTVLFAATVNPDNPTNPVLPPAPIFKLQFQVTHLEYNIGAVDPAGYQPSSWLMLIIPSTLPSDGSFVQRNVPIPLRQFPTPPVLTQAQWSQGDPNVSIAAPTSITEAKRWTYAFQYEHLFEPRDVVVAEVQYNTGDALRVADNKSLGAALVCFRRKYIFVRQQLDTNPNAVDWLLDLVSQVASADWQSPTYALMVQPVIDEYAITTDLLPGKINTDMVSRSKSPKASILRLLPKETTPTNPQTIDHSPTEYIVKYDWPNHPSRPLLIRELVFGIPDVTEWENAWGGVGLLRNSNLFNGLPGLPALQVRPDFFYRTPVRFGTILTPAIQVSGPLNLSSVGPKPLPLAQHLSSLFTELFPDLSNPKIVRLRTLYKFSIRGDSASSPNTDLVVNTPITFWPNLRVEQQTLPALVAAVVSDLLTWKSNHQCAETGAFGFDIAVLASSGSSGLPVLHFQDLRLPLAAVKF